WVWLAKVMEMTDSLSNLSTDDSESSPSDAAVVLPNAVSPAEANSDSRGQVGVAPNSASGISPDELTVISQVANPESQRENVNSLEGRRIGHFELKQFLGGGGMGLVFRAFDSLLSRSVAIKLLPRSGTTTDTVQRFQGEAKSAARLDHPNISRVFQVGSDEACDYIIFEFVEGDNLAQLVRRIGPLPLELGLRYTFQLALAIQHAYQRGVVHRDVKPANVVVTDGGKLKLIDLGLARSPKSKESDQSLTATGVTLGTYDYLSPEQARDSHSADVRSDLYSLGCTLFFMFTGQPPYPQGTPIEKIIQHSSEKRPNPSDYRSDLPPGFNAITSKLLAIDPNDRYQRPAELIADIQEFSSKNNIPLLGYDDNVVVKKIIQKPSWVMQLIPVLVPTFLLIGFVVYLDFSDRNAEKQITRSTNANFATVGKLGAGSKGEDSASDEETPGRDLNLPAKSVAGPEETVIPLPETENRKKPSTEGKELPDQKNGPSPSVVAGEEMADPLFVSVGGSPSTVKGGLEVDDLEAAFEAVNNDPRLNEIRLFKDSILLTKPISVKVNQSLKVTSAGNSESIIVFRPEAPGLSSLFKIRGGNVDFHKVHFRLETGRGVSDAGLVAPQTLFELEGVNSSTFSDCSLTIDNFDDDGQEIIEEARFFSITPPKKGMAMFDISPREPLMKKPVVTFRNCCVRGEAGFIHMEETFPITIQFNNGLLVSDRRVFEFGPANSSTDPSKSEIEIYLVNFTSISSQGFVRLDAGPSSNSLPIRIDATRSIFNFGSKMSFVRHENSPIGFSKSKALVLKCDDSFFPLKNPLWSIRYLDAGNDPESLNFDSMGDWLNVAGVVGDTADVTWENFEGLAIPPSEHTVFDYKLSGGFGGNPAVRKKAGLATDEFSPIPAAFRE
ncbi:MAG: serine/threonine-protein kinase, partial [Planctomycetota bacterium]|nr:serine/threonine-protein kinase [Planctomycetota bacterium]